MSDPPTARVCLGHCPPCSPPPSCLPPRRVLQGIFQEGVKSRQLAQNGGADRSTGHNRLGRVHGRHIRQLEQLLHATCIPAAPPRCSSKGFLRKGRKAANQHRTEVPTCHLRRQADEGACQAPTAIGTAPPCPLAPKRATIPSGILLLFPSLSCQNGDF